MEKQPPRREPPRSARVEQLRDDIDRGRSGDRAPDRDPAAAPLGSDEEAAGRPVPEVAVAAARRQERADGPRPHSGRTRGRGTWMAAILVLVLLCAAGAGLALL